MSVPIQQPIRLQGQRKRRILNWFVVIIAFLIFFGILIHQNVIIININTSGIDKSIGNYYNIISLCVLVVSIIGLVVTILAYFKTRNPSNDSGTRATSPAMSSSIVSQTPVSIDPLPSTSRDEELPASQDIAGPPPPINVSTIYPRDKDVKNLYTVLTSPGVTAVVLTGIDGVGKTILAALVCQAEKNRAGSRFKEEPLWIEIDSRVTLAYLSGILFEAVGKTLPENFRWLSPRKQALELFNALRTDDKARLIILDQFDNLLDGQTGYVLADRPGVSEWLDLINSQPCSSESKQCQFLFTSRVWPKGIHEYNPTYMQEYHVGGLSEEEGIELLRKWVVKGTEEELLTAVKSCDGHAFTLSQLRSFLDYRNLSVSALLKDPAYIQCWIGDVARNRLDRIAGQLNSVQHKLLLAFSVYRDAVPLNAAAQVLLSFIKQVTETQIRAALDVLLTQHLLQKTSKAGYYQLHPVVASYAQNYLIESDTGINQQDLREAHDKAANYYRHEAETNCTFYGSPQNSADEVLSLKETIWHQCQATQLIYDLLQEESLFFNSKSWEDDTILFKLQQLLLPLTGKWQPDRSQVARIYNDLGRVYDVLKQEEQARNCYIEALSIFKGERDLAREGTTLCNIGMFYFEQERIALACFLLAKNIFSNIPSLDSYRIARCLEKLKNKIGEHDFAELLREVEMQAEQIVESTLSMKIKSIS